MHRTHTHRLLSLLFLTATAASGCLSGAEDVTGEVAEPAIVNDGSWGGYNQGGGIALLNVDGDATPDMAIVRVDAPEGEHFLYYRIGFDVQGSGNTHLPSSYSPFRKVPGGIGTRTAGAGVATTELNGNAQPELVVVYVDDASGTDVTWLRIGWDVDAYGIASRWDAPQRFEGGFHGAFTAGADVAVRDVNGDGAPDLIVATVDDPSEDNVVYWSVGYGLTERGTFSGGYSPTYAKPGGIGWRTSDLGLAVADMNHDGKQDLVVSWTDDPHRNTDVHYVQIGYDLGAAGEVRFWGPIRSLGALTTGVTTGTGIAVHDFNRNGSLDFIRFNLSHNDAGDFGDFLTFPDRSDLGSYAIQFRRTQNCLVPPFSGVNLMERPCGNFTRQVWLAANMGDGWYALVNQSTGRCAEIEGGSTAALTPNLEERPCLDLPKQQFRFINAGLGYSSIQVRVSNLCVESFYPSSAWISQGPCDAWDPQRVTLLPRD